jgi:putative hydrolase of the HAD superfamily
VTLRIPDRVVLFDYGEVISHGQSAEDRAALLQLAGVHPDVFWPEYWRDRALLDQGRIDTAEYWGRMGERLNVTWPPSRIHALWVADFRSWLSVNLDVFDVLLELHEGGTRLALLSNAGFDYGSYFRHGPSARFFERFFVSAELDLLKPDPAIFTRVLGELGITADRALFVDNKEENVAGAESIGIAGHVFVTADGLREFLATFTAA